MWWSADGLVRRKMIKHGKELGGRTLADMYGYGSIELKVGCTLLSVTLTLRSAQFKSRPLQIPCLCFCAPKPRSISIFKAIRNLTTACAQVRFSVGILFFYQGNGHDHDVPRSRKLLI